MSIITTYPQILSVSGEDLLVIADMSVLGTPTRTVRVDQIIGTGGGGGTVLKVDGGNSSFINIAGGPITVSGTLTASLSATGTPSSSTYLRGDNTWATISGGNVGTVTSVSYSTNIAAFTAAVTNATSTPSLTLNLNGGSAGQFLRQDGTWATISGSTSPAGSDTQVQYNNSGAFGAGAFFTTNKTSKVDVKYELGLVGDGTNQGLLKLYCEAGTPHYVGIKGPNHSGGSSYTLQLPNTLPAVANQILESNASGTLSWIATPSGGGGTVTSVTGQDGIVMTGSAAAPVVNVDYLGTDNYILTGTEATALLPIQPGDHMAFSTSRTGNAVYYTTMRKVIDKGNGYVHAALKLTPVSGAAPTLTVIYNNVGGTWSVTRLSAGNYEINNTSALFTDKTICFINNSNYAAPSSGTGELPQLTNIRRKSTTVISIENYNVETGTVSGIDADFGLANVVYVLSLIHI